MTPECNPCTEGARLGRIEGGITKLDIKIGKLTDALRGNGKPGLFTEFAVLKATISGIVFLNVIIVTAIVGLWFTK